MQETIATLQKAIKAHQSRESGYLDTIASLADKIETLVAAQTRLLMLSERFKRDMGDMKQDIGHLQQTVIEIAETQVKNTESCKKFEAGYWQGVGE